MRKTAQKKKLNGGEVSPKGEVDSDSLISDDVSDGGNSSRNSSSNTPLTKRSKEESENQKSDLKKMGQPKRKERKNSKPSAAADSDIEEKNNSSDEEDGKVNVPKKKKKVGKSKEKKKTESQTSDQKDDGSDTEDAKANAPKEKQISGNSKEKKKPTSDVEYEVDQVVGMKEKKGRKLYLIRWKGYDKSSDTWEPELELNCPAKIAAYLEANPQEDEEGKVPKKKSAAKKRKSAAKEKKTAKRVKADASDSEEATEEYEVEKIIEIHHKKNGKKEYLVRWKGYSSKDDTWEPEEHLQCADLIAKLHSKIEKSKELGERELRVNPAHSKPYTLTMVSSGRRVSRRGDGKQRARYHESE